LVVGYDRARYERLLEVLHLTLEADRLPSLLSGGELQKTRLLLALLRRHDVLLLDEPFANIDDESRAALSVELESVRSTRAIVLVSHLADSLNASIKGANEFELLRPQN
jgi:ABC-type nitrate/sulfonate/bicarbonate transport system ATPase subunit